MTNLFYEITNDGIPFVEDVQSSGRPPSRSLLFLYNSMLEAQKQNGGFELTLRELKVAWNLHSTNTVFYHLKKLVKRGFVKTKPRGSRGKTYRAVELPL